MQFGVHTVLDDVAGARVPDSHARKSSIVARARGSASAVAAVMRAAALGRHTEMAKSDGVGRDGGIRTRDLLLPKQAR
jgi:hypothetical protein